MQLWRHTRTPPPPPRCSGSKGSWFDVSDNQLSGGLPAALRNLAAFGPDLGPRYPTSDL